MHSPASRKPERLWCIFAYSLLIAAAALFFCSKSSFGYPINDWTDANIYFTIGKGMAQGQLVYRDLYDHKGPLLYALHALCALLSPMSFTGVYVLEVLCAAAFLTCVYRILALYQAQRMAVPALALTALIVYTSASFSLGDSAEELCLPLLAYSLFALLRHFKTEFPRRMSAAQLVCNGLLFGCVFWMKFTLIGLHAAFLLLLFLSQASQQHWKQAFACVGWFALGFVASTLPWLLYFGLNGALLPWLKTYLYDNLFLYSSTEEAAGLLTRIKAMGRSGLSWLFQNPLYTLPLAGGLLWGACRKHASVWERLCFILPAFVCALGVFIGGKSYPYYGLVLAVFAPLGLIPPCLWLHRRLENGFARSRTVFLSLAALFCAACLALCPVLSPNVQESFRKPKAETMQYQFAEILNRYESPSLLNYGFMDAGFYTAAGIVPNVKYFQQNNVPLPEMLEEQVRYVREGVCDFVVTRGKQPDCIHDQYELIATANSPEGYWYEHVYLYKLKSLPVQ
ncbi:MAG: glycosyltransferase family 39 protein [Clostridia bacterium]